MDAIRPIPTPNSSMAYLETRISSLPVADGLRYVRNTSYVISDETLTSCEEPAAVTAVNTMASIKMAPMSPMISAAAVGATRPSPI